MSKKVFCYLLIAFSIVIGCARTENRLGHSSSTGTIDKKFTMTREEAQSRLRELIKEYIQETGQSTESKSVPVIHKRPYYYREFFIYPEGPEGFQVNFKDVDSRTRPLAGEVHIKKIRYSTRMHRKYDLAAADTDFLRDMGVETLIFEWRNGRWIKTGALFEAESTEVQINGQWTPLKEKTVRISPGEERPGWFGRLWERIRGGE